MLILFVQALPAALALAAGEIGRKGTEECVAPWPPLISPTASVTHTHIRARTSEPHCEVPMPPPLP